MPDTETNVITFRPAKREGVGLFIGVNGGTGSGKTYTALRLASGIVGPNGKIAAGDTEGRRMSHYASQFNFDAVDILPPFRPEKFEEVAKAAEAGGYGCLILDSFSHEHAGEGGVLEWHDEELDRAYARALQNAEHPESVNEDAVRNANNMRGWIKPKAAHKAMINSFLQRRIPIIFCMRAEEKVKVLGNGKPVPMGWQPICDKNFGYELTCMVTLSNENPGRTDYKLPRKIEQQHLHLFPDGKFITEEAGAKLAAWARGEDISPEAKKTAAPKPAAKKADPPVTDKPATPSGDKTAKIADDIIKRIGAQESVDAVEAIFKEDLVGRQMVWMKAHRLTEHDRVMKAADDRNLALNKPAQESEPPTELPQSEPEGVDSAAGKEGEQVPEN